MPNSQIDMVTFEELKQMSGEDFIAELVQTFLEDAPKIIQELKSALESGDPEAFRRAAHSLKSNSATFGATRLAEMAKELEMMGKESRLDSVGNRLQALEQAYGMVADELAGLSA